MRVLADTRTKRMQLLTRHVCGRLQELLGYVVNAIIVQSEAVCAIGSVDELTHVFTDAENNTRFVICFQQ